MAYDLEFPSWILNQRNADTEIGMQMGRNILEGLRFQQQKRMYQEEAPLREAQLVGQMAQNTIAEQRIQANALNASLQANAQAGMTEALALEGDIAGRSGGWLDPETPVRVNRLLTQFPGLADTPWHQRLLQNIGTAQKAKQQEDMERQRFENEMAITKERNAGDVVVQEIRNEQAKGAAPEAAWSDYNEIVARVGDPVVALDELARSATGAYSGKIKIAKQAISSQVGALKSAGIPVTADDIGYALSQQLTAGSGAANAAVAKDIQSEDKAALLLDKAVQKMEEFDAKYGKGAFDEYIGPFDNRKSSLERKMLNRKYRSGADVEADRVFQYVNLIIQGYRKNNFGTALTANETAAFKEIVSDPTFNNYVDSIKGFRDAMRDSVSATVGNYKLSPNIPLPIKERWLGGKQAPAQQQPAAQSGTLTREQAAQFLRDAGGDKERARQMARDAGFSF